MMLLMIVTYDADVDVVASADSDFYSSLEGMFRPVDDVIQEVQVENEGELRDRGRGRGGGRGHGWMISSDPGDDPEDCDLIYGFGHHCAKKI
ncbi:hypothetical protein LIER_10538 [Lithospermum erythrorhizon]|uniref:Uncharacterized protein n=1 Tax=Lithospermum erythrorhizon TaxID=34254 RepID=A0AAV3PLQ0_LITER